MMDDGPGWLLIDPTKPYYNRPEVFYGAVLCP